MINIIPERLLIWYSMSAGYQGHADECGTRHECLGSPSHHDKIYKILSILSVSVMLQLLDSICQDDTGFFWNCEAMLIFTVLRAAKPGKLPRTGRQCWEGVLSVSKAVLSRTIQPNILCAGITYCAAMSHNLNLQILELFYCTSHTNTSGIVGNDNGFEYICDCVLHIIMLGKLMLQN